ncbi:WYL domain-containing protein [Lysinibacter sp. HNR]|uniref:helix-turn-helix transcriptional regulator n=1 Tax=Lysinibacter sp. HNR TaxID=3031408 RepID=UPI0024359E28|nr:WYL domain-containing protein [Lysinibacter sp. HNR]WGD36218.1 WYL domain-containing protein [Lysinibacter sp. HNR]
MALPQSRSVPTENRLFSVVLALVASRNGLTKQQILSSVYGYAERFVPGANNASLERQFERDKDSIRELGIPLETIDAPEEPGNNQLTRYQIRKEGYQVPPGLSFDAHERALLALASTVWREGSLSAESRRSLMKLSSLGVDSDDSLLGYSPRVHTRDASFGALLRAVETQQQVTFDYARPGEKAYARTVVPLALVSFSSRWHLFSFDIRLHSPRTFLLSRIVSTVRVSNLLTSFIPDNTVDYATEALTQLRELARKNVARVRVQVNTDASARLQARAVPDTDAQVPALDTNGYHTIIIGSVDNTLLADELAGYGPDVIVDSPSHLRVAVRDQLQRAVAIYG